METKYKIYFQKFGGEFFGSHVYAAWEGFQWERSLIEYECHFFEEIEEVPARKTNIVIGSIEETVKHFNRIGVPIPDPLNVPPELMKYVKRDYKVITMGELRANPKPPLFIKPSDFVKGYNLTEKFSAGVFKNESSIRMFFGFVPDDFRIVISEVIEMVTEFRCFVNNGKLVGIQRYIGDFTKFLNPEIVKQAIADYTSAPRCYTIDFAVTDSGDTVLIELNDLWSVSHYGIESDIYARLIFDRWVELTK